MIETELRRPYRLWLRTVGLSEAMVRQERDFADCLMETAQVMVLVLDRQGGVVRLNHAGERLTGYALAQVQGRPFWEVFPAPEEVDAAKEAFYHLIAGDFPQASVCDWVAKDGSRRLIAWSTTTLTGEDGAVARVIGTGLDLTDRREAENRLHRPQAELERKMLEVADRTRELEVMKRELESITEMVSHDIRAPLRWLSGFCQALEDKGTDRLDFKGRRYLSRWRTALQQAKGLIEVLAQRGRLATAAMRRQEIDLSVQAHTIAEDLWRAAPARQVEFVIGTGLSAEGDPAMLREVLENLLGNAWKFTEKVPQGKIDFEALPAMDGSRGFLVRDNRAG